MNKDKITDACKKISLCIIDECKLIASPSEIFDPFLFLDLLINTTCMSLNNISKISEIPLNILQEDFTKNIKIITNIIINTDIEDGLKEKNKCL